MTALLTIGEFSRLTFLSVKALRHYHDVGLLDPALVDRSTGYRSYATDQVATAQLIRRLRDLDMPLDGIGRVVSASDEGSRDQLIVRHLDDLEAQLARTKVAIDALRALLERPWPDQLDYRDEPARPVLARHGAVELTACEEWVRNALFEMLRYLRHLGVRPAGPPGALIAGGLMEDGVGEVTAFVPLRAPIAWPDGPDAGFAPDELPAARVAVMTHKGPYSQVCNTYGALGSRVAERGEAAPGPTREYFTVTHVHTYDPARLRTEICWPVRADAGAAR